MRKFLLSILKQIESLKDGVIAYAYRTSNAPKTFRYWEVSVSDFDLYMNDNRFKQLTKEWHEEAERRGERIIFICGWVPTEERLLKLAEEDNLVLNL